MACLLFLLLRLLLTMTVTLLLLMLAAVPAEWNGLDLGSHPPATGSKPANLLP
jgi:hypothetical protein